jgi:hypothetical protein
MRDRRSSAGTRRGCVSRSSGSRLRGCAITRWPPAPSAPANSPG